jgi:OOP family OmpA-OmpF porin
MSNGNGKIVAGLAAALATTAAWPATSRAQIEPNGAALDRYEPPEPGDPFLSVPSPSIGGHLVPRLMLTYDVAYIPLEIEDAAGDSIPVIWGTQVLHANASFALWDRLMIGVGMPFVIDQGPGFPSATIDGVAYRSPNAAEVGDLRAGLRGRLFGEYEDPFQISLGSYFYFPTGPDQSYVAEGSFYAQPHLLLGGRARPFIWSVNAGAMIRSSGNPHAFTFGGAAGVLLFHDVLQIGPEATGQVAFSDWELYPQPSPSVGRVNAEVLLSATANMFNMFTAGVAGGLGLTNAPGTPDGRALVRFGYAPQPPPGGERPPDADGDNVPDEVDHCPETPGVASAEADENGCPRPVDSDGDGVVDNEDACPNRKGEASPDAAKNGCPGPSDRDSDGVLDSEDACPDKPGEAGGEPVIRGCPRPVNEPECVYEGEPCPTGTEAGPDQDGDGVVDNEDACPKLPGKANADPVRNGCPPGRTGDQDGDGIIDSKDACPKRPGKTDPDVTKNGCPEAGVPTGTGDQDADGVIDSKDACPTVAGRTSGDPAKNGCPETRTPAGVPPAAGAHRELEVLNIRFEINQAELRPETEASLDEMARYLKSHPEILLVEVQGHADETGPEGYNKQLSWLRATTARDALVRRGVDFRRLKPVGYGESRPIANNDTEEGRRANRRVQLVVLQVAPD